MAKAALGEYWTKQSLSLHISENKAEIFFFFKNKRKKSLIEMGCIRSQSERQTDTTKEERTLPKVPDEEVD